MSCGHKIVGIFHAETTKLFFFPTKKSGFSLDLAIDLHVTIGCSKLHSFFLDLDNFPIHPQLLESSEGPVLRRRRHLDSSKPYIAAKLASLPPTFILGDETKYNGFYNKPLTSGQEYRCFVLAVLRSEKTTDNTANYVRDTHTLSNTFIYCMKTDNHSLVQHEDFFFMKPVLYIVTYSFFLSVYHLPRWQHQACYCHLPFHTAAYKSNCSLS